MSSPLGQVLDHFGRGNAAFEAGRYAAALAEVDDQALAWEPDLAAAWTVRGSLLREAGDGPGAARCFEQALALGGDQALNRF